MQCADQLFVNSLRIYFVCSVLIYFDRRVLKYFVPSGIIYFVCGALYFDRSAIFINMLLKFLGKVCPLWASVANELVEAPLK